MNDFKCNAAFSGFSLANQAPLRWLPYMTFAFAIEWGEGTEVPAYSDTLGT